MPPSDDDDQVIIRVFTQADLQQVHEIFAAGMRHYHSTIPEDIPGGRETMLKQWCLL
jgi:hypothetical protein